ncbi:acyl-CoA dehydrogenase [Modestobacter sp. I12A-02628]|uniref:Acyl-CoA/acyl-ACP dehydrogenase n=1 Tax=Goekera deserti TaxID=2497753 RepID=A0A7K3W9R9_9ACTN|nr:acyl-CoA dehydrogenase family protein [Goekera deserti]MPQ98896.1 acyl-CoA dehydrogenase [Goekera deserti]NDI49605.1 acyl-CoA dehydrogenase [Goekera deserti]NEL53202.1 acyl-CoA/acyl-ACP dehydrogenase [Goekera deserti]
MTDVVSWARGLADEVLFPAAGEVERAGRVPSGHLAALADAGLYGLTGPADAGGLAADALTVQTVVELLAGGDLATTFVWLQHLGVVRLVADAPGPLRAAHLEDLCAGRLRAGIALQAANRPGPPAVRARLDGGDVVLDGAVPWVTGWDHVDVVLVAARTADDDVVLLLVDAVAGGTLAVRPQTTVAVTASATVDLTLRGHRVPAGRLVLQVPFLRWRAGDQAGLRLNGSLALGVAGRCARSVRELAADRPALGALAEALTRAVDDARRTLDTAAPAELPAARAAASALAHRASGALVTAAGSAAIGAGHPAQRLAREALFLLVFGSRPAVRTALLDHLTP